MVDNNTKWDEDIKAKIRDWMDLDSVRDDSGELAWDVLESNESATDDDFDAIHMRVCDLLDSACVKVIFDG